MSPAEAEDKARRIAIAVDQWISEVHDADEEGKMTVEQILASFQALCTEFDIPPQIAKNAIARALDVPVVH